ncbi:hypothetical protein TCAL_16846 [Tigriopus californicus]|uniref:Transmembrane protein 177 n=2 Tax=Tigriopus californicus TaxID=6832 RepID=A0A553PDZ1_TIGCA|nr:hypothetical protein TCAL_16846 [Tigriopus californicus]
MVLKVIQDLNEKPVAEECVTLFQIRHMFPFVMGLPAKSVFCGIPLHFQWSDESQVDLKSIPPHVVWLYGSRFTTVELGLDESKVAKEDFKSFKECLILSEKAKRFAIAQQVFPTVNHHHFALFMLPFVAIHACFFAGFGLLKDPSMSQGMKRLKLPIAAGFALLAPLLAFIVMGHYYYNLVQRWDSYLTHSLDSEYVEGGVEYLEKTLKIGKLLRQYVKFGDYYFQEDGQQINYWFDVSQMSPDPNSRLSNFKEFLESKTESDGNSNKKE